MIESLSIVAPQTGYCYNLIRKSLDAGKKTLQNKEVEEEKRLEDIKKVQPVQQTYNSRGKTVERVLMGSFIDLEI